MSGFGYWDIVEGLGGRQECTVCGCVVADAPAHTEWHRKLEGNHDETEAEG